MLVRIKVLKNQRGFDVLSMAEINAMRYFFCDSCRSRWDFDYDQACEELALEFNFVCAADANAIRMSALRLLLVVHKLKSVDDAKFDIRCSQYVGQEGGCKASREPPQAAEAPS